MAGEGGVLKGGLEVADGLAGGGAAGKIGGVEGLVKGWLFGLFLFVPAAGCAFGTLGGFFLGGFVRGGALFGGG